MYESKLKMLLLLSKVDAVAQYQPKGDYVTENRLDENRFWYR